MWYGDRSVWYGDRSVWYGDRRNVGVIKVVLGCCSEKTPASFHSGEVQGVTVYGIVYLHKQWHICEVVKELHYPLALVVETVHHVANMVAGQTSCLQLHG